MNRRFVELEGVVKSVGDKALWFREPDAHHDICIPLSQVEEAHAISDGQSGIRCTAWILSRLEDEGKR